MSESDTSRREFVSSAAKGAWGAAMAAGGRALGANDRIRLGVIGVGSRGTNVMGWFQKEPGAEVAALCDCYEDNLLAARAKTEGKAKTYADYRALLEARDLDAVLIATPDPWHKRMAVDSCAAGKDVYVEKPLTFSISEGHEIIRAVKNNGRVMQVGLQQRSGEHYAAAKREYIDSRKIGTVSLVRTWWHGNTYHLRKPGFKDQPKGLDWKAFLGPVPFRPFDAHQFYNWRAYLDFGGGQITDLFTHWIDVVHWYLGEDLPLSADAAGGVFAYPDGRTAPDTITLQLQYPRKWVATFEATLVPGARGAAIEFLGTEGSLQIDRTGYTWQARSQRKEATVAPVVVRNPLSLEQLHVRNFLDCLRSRKQPNSDVVSGHRSALASHLGKMSYLKKKRVVFQPSSEKDHVLKPA